jgi:hypothetical protein
MRVDSNCLRVIPTARASTSFMLLILSLFPAFIHHNSPPAPREPIAPSPWILSQLAPATKRFHSHLRFHSQRSARRKAQATAMLSKNPSTAKEKDRTRKTGQASTAHPRMCATAARPAQ